MAGRPARRVRWRPGPPFAALPKYLPGPMNLGAAWSDQGTEPLEDTVLRRFLLRTVAFVGLIVPATFALALLAAPAYPAPVQASACGGNLQQAQLSLAAVQARVQQVSKTDGANLCSANQRYFFELVKTRAVTASCELGPERDRALVRLDADVAHINSNIAAICR